MRASSSSWRSRMPAPRRSPSRGPTPRSAVERSRMNRKEFLGFAGALAASVAAGAGTDRKAIAARAITMWDFSWLERRWTGAGYEDWDQVLDGLVERGYDAVRIDAFPHLVHFGAEKEWQ